jgi:Major Facilitator Superfamily
LNHLHTASATAAPGSLWRDRNFLLLFAANTLSVLGSAVTQMALPLTAVQLLRASATEMGVLIACQLLPFVILGLPAGVWIDRSRKRHLAVAFDLCAALGLLLVPLAWFGGFLSIPLLCGVGFLVKTQEAIGGSAMQAFITQLVGRERLVLANSKLSGAASVAQVVGPALAALLVALLGAPLAIIADAASFLISALLVARIRFQEVRAVASPLRLWPQIREGLQLVWQTPMLRHLVWVVCLWIGLNDGFAALYVLFAARELGLDPSGIALINTLGALGGLGGALVAHWLERRIGIRNTLVAGVLIAAFGYLAYALPARQMAHVAWLAGAALCLLNVGGTIYVVNYLSLRQAVSPDALLGRVVTSMRFLSILPTPLMTILIGRAGDGFGLVPVFIGIGLSCLLLGLAAVRYLPHD